MKEAVISCLEAVGADDLSALSRLERECFSGEAWSTDSIGGFLGNSAVTAVAARLDGALVGAAYAISVCDEAEILKVAVKSDFRRRGLARAMLSELERTLRGSGVRRLLLEVRRGNGAARALYASLGYAEYGERRGYYVSPREDAVLMEKTVGSK